MGPLSNSRHERFAQSLFEGKSADESYVLAGYSENRGNAARLKANESISRRLAELQEAAAKSSEVTVQSLLAELQTVCERAGALNQWGTVVKSVAEKAKISGLLTTKIEITDLSEF